LRLDDIDWRQRRLQIHRSKTRATLVHPLRDEVATALVTYIRDGRPAWPLRQVFLRGRFPVGGISPTAVTEAFQKWVRRSALPVPHYGAHCLRHSLAIRLLRQGANLKTIGDVLGHRSIESTAVYLRLHIEDLRGVGLDVPVAP
jgi:integrase